jgi:Tat protein translocase TatB subunit
VFNLGAPEVMVVLLVALLILGPQRLPQAGKQVGRAIAEFRRVTSGVQQEIKEALDVSELRDAFDLNKLLADDPTPTRSAPPVTASATAAVPSPSTLESGDPERATGDVAGDVAGSRSGPGGAIPAPDGSSYFPPSDPVPSVFDHVPAPTDARDVLAER